MCICLVNCKDKCCQGTKCVTEDAVHNNLDSYWQMKSAAHAYNDMSKCKVQESCYYILAE